MEKTLGEKAPVLTDADKAKRETSNNFYKAVQGDIVDELLAKYINSMEVAVPVRRLGEGFYLFGTRKIYAKVLNNKLVVRVGGGFMSFTEFIDTYAMVELKKINELQAQGNWDLEQFINGVMEQESPQSKYQVLLDFKISSFVYRKNDGWKKVDVANACSRKALSFIWR